MEHESDGNTNYKWRAWNDPQKIGKGSDEDKNRRTSRDYPNHSIIEVS